MKNLGKKISKIWKSILRFMTKKSFLDLILSPLNFKFIKTHQGFFNGGHKSRALPWGEEKSWQRWVIQEKESRG